MNVHAALCAATTVTVAAMHTTRDSSFPLLAVLPGGRLASESSHKTLRAWELPPARRLMDESSP